jgi:disulfide bond formation protein DsbB
VKSGPEDLTGARAIALAVPSALLGGAYIAQYVFGLPPCEMCWWQRYALFAALAFAVLSLLKRDNKMLISLAGLGILASGLIGGFHAGVEYGWWQGMTACTGNAATGDDPLASVMGAAIVRCDVAAWKLAGISLAGFNFLISVPAALALFALLRRRSGTRL